MIMLRKHRAFLVLAAFAAALFLSDIWIYKEFVRAESYFALGSRLMIERGEWLAPHAPDEFVLNKPPLTYWLIGTSFKFLGPSYGAARVPSVLAAIGVLAIVYALGAWMKGTRTGLVSAAMLASSYLFLSFARLAMSDMLLTLCVTAAVACFIVALSEQTERARRLAIIGYVALALGVLTKGPLAVALVVIPLVIEILLSRDPGRIKRLRVLPGVIFFVILTAPYFLLVYWRLGSEPLRFFFLGENVLRFTGEVYGAGARPFWYELAAFFGDFAPWSLLVFLGWFPWRANEIDEGKRRTTRILYLWLVCTILLFSLSRFKLDYYLLPAMPAAALIIGSIVASSRKLSSAARWTLNAFFVFSSMIVLLVALLALKFAGALAVQTSLRFVPLVVALVGLGAIVSYVVRRNLRDAAMGLAAVIWATALSMQLIFTPAFTRYLPAERLAGSVGANRVVYTSWFASDWANCLAFNLPPPHKVDRLIGDQSNEKLLAVLNGDPRAVAVIRQGEYEGLAKNNPWLRILAESETYGHGGLNVNMLRNAKRDRLLLIGRQP